MSFVLTMGLIKHLTTESKVFSIYKYGNFVSITEKSWRVLRELSMGLHMVQWFAKFLHDCLYGNLKDFYSIVREGNCSFIM